MESAFVAPFSLKIKSLLGVAAVKMAGPGVVVLGGLGIVCITTGVVAVVGILNRGKEKKQWKWLLPVLSAEQNGANALVSLVYLNSMIALTLKFIWLSLNVCSGEYAECQNASFSNCFPFPFKTFTVKHSTVINATPFRPYIKNNQKLLQIMCLLAWNTK